MIDFNQQYMWNNLYKESYLSSVWLDKGTVIQGTLCTEDVVANNQEDFCEWTKAA